MKLQSNIDKNFLTTDSTKEPLVDFYFKATKYFKQIYGEKVMVLLQCGSFIEMYGHPIYDKEYDDYKDINYLYNKDSSIDEVARYVDLAIANKLKNKDNNKVTLTMSGLNTQYIDKITNKIVNELGYIVPIYLQDENNVKLRHLITIESPGTTFNAPVNATSNNICCINIQLNKPNIINPKYTIFFGMSSINVLTGECNIHEYSLEYKHQPSTYDEIEKYISIYSPKELIIIYESNTIDIDTIKQIIQYIEYNGNNVRYLDINTANTITKNTLEHCALNCGKQVYQHNIIEYYYKNSYNIDELFQSFSSNYIAAHSFCFLIEYVSMHNSGLADKIKEPNVHDKSNKLLLANHSLKQLNFLDNDIYVHNLRGDEKKLTSVVSFLSSTQTYMGKRRFNSELMNPITNKHVLMSRYNIIHYINDNYKECFEDIRTKFKKYKDLERLYRKIVLKQITPSEIYSIISNLETTLDISKLIDKHHYPFEKLLNNTNEYKNVFSNIDPHLCQLYNHFKLNINIEYSSNTDIDTFTTHFFNRGIYVDLDNLYRDYVETYDILNSIKNFLSDIVKSYESKPKDVDYCKLYFTDKLGYTIRTTEARYKKINTKLKQYMKDSEYIDISYVSSFDNSVKNYKLNLKDITKEKKNSDVIIVSKQINKLISNNIIFKEEFKKLLKNTYYNFLDELKELDEYFTTVVEYIIFLDTYITKSYISLKYNYCKPSINMENSNAYFEAKDMRHLLIERMSFNEYFVPNSIQLGKDDEENGILLYGTNASGKSSLIKAIGICVILAQAGMYVPCSDYIYKPFTTIFTRILGNDNIFKGMSTFAVEISELNTILKMSNENSLILGDELCSGTEIGSAAGIFGSGIVSLHNRNSKFIFATHLHQINDLPIIKSLDKLKFKHLSIIYDSEKQELIYDRKLKDGPGSNTYGIEVCKSLGLPKEFMDLAYQIRSNLYNDIHTISSFKQSKYNSKKLLGICEMCGKKADEIHHKLQQKDADTNGFIGTIHKNHISNLMSICEECHDKIHQ